MAKKVKKATRGLTIRQRRFCELYMKYFNKTRAAKEAGYSERSAASIGYELLRKPEIKAYIHERVCAQDAAFVASADEALAFLSGVMRGDIKDQFDLDAALADRIRASEALMKRLDAAAAGKAAVENGVTITFVATEGGEE